MFVLFFLPAVQQKAALEKEAKLSILEAGVADVSTRFVSLSRNRRLQHDELLLTER